MLHLRVVTTQQGGAKCARQRAHEHGFGGIELIGQDAQAIHRAADVIDCCHWVTTVAGGHCLDQCGADGGDGRRHLFAEDHLDFSELREDGFQRRRGRFRVLVCHHIRRLQGLRPGATRDWRGGAYVIRDHWHDAPDGKDKRPQHRPAHLRYLEPLAQAGKLLLAGPFTDGSGSLLVIEAESRAAVWDVVARDPYVINGVFNRVDVKPFLQVFPKM